MVPSMTLLALLLLLISALASNALDAHVTKSVEGEPYTFPGPASYIISSGVVCSGNQNCTILAGGFVTTARLLNDSLPDESITNDIFALVVSQTNINFEESVSDDISAVTQMFEHGTAGYAVFWPDLRCVNGTLSGCQTGNDTYRDWTIIQACTPDRTNNGTDIGRMIRQILTDKASAKDVSCDPANVSRAADAPNKACTSDAGRSAVIETTTIAVALFGRLGTFPI
ncbi:hypothetical protein KCU77_g680, partial [Aureobasidium melanogenum]